MEWLSQNWVYLLLLLGVVFMMARGGMGCGMGSHHARSRHDHGGGADRDGASVRVGTTDPVNGHPVDPQTAVATVYRGRDYYFESRENRDRFEAAPEKYAGPAPVGHGEHAQRHHGGCH